MMAALKGFGLEGLWWITPSAALLTSIAAIVIYALRMHAPEEPVATTEHVDIQAKEA